MSGLISFLFCFHSTGFSRLFIWGKWLSVYSRHLPYLQELAQTTHIFGLGVIRTFALYTLAPLKTCQRHQVVLQYIIYSAVQVKLGGWLHQPFKTRYHYCCLKQAQLRESGKMHMLCDTICRKAALYSSISGRCPGRNKGKCSRWGYSPSSYICTGKINSAGLALVLCLHHLHCWISRIILTWGWFTLTQAICRMTFWASTPQGFSPLEHLAATTLLSKGKSI